MTDLSNLKEGDVLTHEDLLNLGLRGEFADGIIVNDPHRRILLREPLRVFVNTANLPKCARTLNVNVQRPPTNLNRHQRRAMAKSCGKVSS